MISPKFHLVPTVITDHFDRIKDKKEKEQKVPSTGTGIAIGYHWLYNLIMAEDIAFIETKHGQHG